MSRVRGRGNKATELALVTFLRHHGIAGVDAKAALDAVHLCAVANIDASWAHRHALIAIDAIADLLT